MTHVLCHHRVKIEGQPMAETYCMRPIGHEGTCSALTQTVNQPTIVIRSCGDIGPEGRPCGLPAGHTTTHSDGTRGWSSAGRKA